MRVFMALLKRELLAYLLTPLALVYISIFLILANSFVFYLGDMFEVGQASMQAFFRILPWVCLLLVPALTMRAWAEEFRLGTYELLSVLPISSWQSVCAKFIALWIVALVGLALSFPLWLTVTWLGQPDHGVIILGYLGSGLLLAAMVSVGLCASSFSSNQLIAYIFSALLLLFFLLAAYPLALNSIREIFPQKFVDVIAALSFLTHLQSMTRGVLELQDVLFYTATCILFLLINIQVLNWRRV